MLQYIFVVSGGKPSLDTRSFTNRSQLVHLNNNWCCVAIWLFGYFSTNCLCRNWRGGLPVITRRTMGIPVRTTSVAQGTVIRPLQRARRWRVPTASAIMKVKHFIVKVSCKTYYNFKMYKTLNFLSRQVFLVVFVLL